MPEERMNEELAPAEEALRALAPSPSRLDFGQVMYQAGRASVVASAPRASRHARWICFSLAAGTLLVAGGFVGARAFWGDPEIVERIVYVEKLQPEQPAHDPVDVLVESEGSDNRWQEHAELCWLVATQGLDGLPEPRWKPLSYAGSQPWDPLRDPVMETGPEG
jgi:hypothetical protein